jgi:hypothetical protein
MRPLISLHDGASFRSELEASELKSRKQHPQSYPAFCFKRRQCQSCRSAGCCPCELEESFHLGTAPKIYLGKLESLEASIRPLNGHEMLTLMIAIFATLGAFKRPEGIVEESEGSMLLPVSYEGYWGAVHRRRNRYLELKANLWLTLRVDRLLV